VEHGHEDRGVSKTGVAGPAEAATGGRSLSAAPTFALNQ